MPRILPFDGQLGYSLGWASVVAAALEHGPRKPGMLAHDIFQIATEEDARNQWRVTAGMKPLSKPFSHTTAKNIVRWSELNRIYQPQTLQLTDIGRTLWNVEPWRPKQQGSPFVWGRAKQLVGLHIQVANDGDFLVPLLRAWPSEGLQESSTEALKLLRRILELEVDNEKVQGGLLNYHLANLQSMGFVNNKLEFELSAKGLFGVIGLGHEVVSADSWHLSRSGTLLHLGLLDFEGADDLLKQGVSRLFLETEERGGSPLVPGTAEDLRQTIRLLPPGLRGAHFEAPLDAVVLLTQARMLETQPNQYMDRALALDLLRQLERHSRGRIGIKAGTTVMEENLTWTGEPVLDDDSLWHLGDPPRLLISHHVVPVAELADPAAIAISAPSVDLTPLEQQPDAASSESTLPWRPRPAALLWLQYLSRILAPPQLGGLTEFRYGGPRAWIDGLGQKLDLPEVVLAKKRGAIKLPGQHDCALATTQIEAWLRDPSKDVESRSLHALCEAWKKGEKGTSTPPDKLRGLLIRADKAVLRQHRALCKKVRDFLAADPFSEGNWLVVREATRALLDDAIHQGLWRRAALRAELLRQRPDPLRLLALLDPDAPSAEKYIYIEERQVSASLLRSLPAKTILQEPPPDPEFILESGEPVPDDGGPLAVTVTLTARTPAQARERARELITEYLCRLQFKAAMTTGEPASGADFEPASVDGASPGQLSKEDGTPYPTENTELPRSIPWQLDMPVRFGFQRIILEQEQQRLRQVLQRIPSLEQRVGRPLLQVDSRSRLARALHWLDKAALARHSPADQLSHAWVAIEHLITSGETDKGLPVVDALSAVATLCHVQRSLGTLYREARAALHASLFRRPTDEKLRQVAGDWLDSDELQRYRDATPEARETPPTLAALHREAHRDCADWSGLSALLGKKSNDLVSLADELKEEAPLVALTLKDLAKRLGAHESKSVNSYPEWKAWLIRVQQDAAAFVMVIYEIRNEVVHEARPFGFHEAGRLADLYAHFRALAEAVIGEVLLELSHDPERPLNEVWSVLEARCAALSECDPTNIEQLKHCLNE